MKYYKIVTKDGKSPFRGHSGIRYDLPKNGKPGARAYPRQKGEFLYALRKDDIHHWWKLGNGFRLFEVELKAPEVNRWDRKVACKSMRLIREVETPDHKHRIRLYQHTLKSKLIQLAKLEDAFDDEEAHLHAVIADCRKQLALLKGKP